MDVPSNEAEQGSSQSPSIMDGISAHLGGGSEPTESTPITVEAVDTVVTTETPTEQAEAAPEEPAQEEATSRFQQRIDELTKREAETRHQNEQLQLLIASNPQLRAAYEQQLMGQQQAYQPNVNADVWYNQNQQQEGNYLPDWDPHDPDVVRQHGNALFAEMLAPLQQQIQQINQFYQQQQQVAVQQQRQTVVNDFDEYAYNELPSARENKAHFAVYNECIKDAVATLQATGGQLTLEDYKVAARVAAVEAKKLIGGFTPALQAQEVKKPFVESGANLVAPRSDEPNDTLGLINAHLNKH